MVLKGKDIIPNGLPERKKGLARKNSEQPIAKFRNNVTYSLLEQDRMRQIIEVVLKLEELENIKELAKLLSTEK